MSGNRFGQLTEASKQINCVPFKVVGAGGSITEGKTYVLDFLDLAMRESMNALFLSVTLTTSRPVEMRWMYSLTAVRRKRLVCPSRSHWPAVGLCWLSQ